MPVYQYDGKHYSLPDGLSDEQAVSKIKSYLGESQPERPTQFDEPSMFDYLTGSARKGHQQNMASGILQSMSEKALGGAEGLVSGAGQVLGGFVGGIGGAEKYLTDKIQGRPSSFEEDVAGAMGAPVYQPRTETGKAINDFTGEALNQLGIPYAGVAHTFPAVSAPDIPRVPKPVKVKDGNAAAAAAEMMNKDLAQRPLDVDLNEGPNMPSQVNMRPNGQGEMLPQDPGFAAAVSRHDAQRPLDDTGVNRGPVYKQGEMFPEELDQARGEGAFSPTNPELTPPPGEVPPRTLSSVSEDAKTQADLSRQQRELEAQREFNKRQMQLEFDVKKQGGLDFNAAERARQEQAPTGYDAAASEAQDRATMAEQHFTKQLDSLKTQMDELQKSMDEHRQNEASKKAAEGADTALARKQQVMEDNVKRQQTIDFNRDERARQEAAPPAGFVGPIRQIAPRKPGGPGGRQGGWILLEGKKKKAIGNLADEIGIKKLGEYVPSFRNAEEAIAAAKKGQDLDQNFIQRGLNQFTKGGQYQALKTHNPVITFTKDMLLKADQLGRADVRDYVHGKLAPAMQRLKAKAQGEIWKMMSLADLTEKPLDLELLAKHGFSTDQLKLVAEHREVMGRALEGANAARKAAGMPPITPRQAYAAMRSTGDFRRVVFDKKGGSVVSVVGSNFRWKTNQLAQQLTDKGYFVGPEKFYGGVNRSRGSPNQAFMEAIQFLADHDPRVQNFVDVLHDLRTKEVYDFLNAKTHTMPKKGIEGMSGRKPWMNAEQNAKEGFQQQLNYAETMIKWGHLSEAGVEINKVLNSKEVDMPKAKQLAEEYMQNAFGFNPSKFGRAAEDMVASLFDGVGIGYSNYRRTMSIARKVVNTMLLGLNPGFWLTQVVQPMQAMPGMKAYLISKGLDAGFDFGTGWSYLAQGAITSMRELNGRELTSFEKAAVDFANKNHTYGSDLVEHTNRARKDFTTAIDKVGGFANASIESGTRRAFYFGIAHLLKENGMKVGDDLFQAAQNITDSAMNNYSPVERPQFYNKLGPIGDVAVNLQSYKANELSRLSLFARQISEEKSARPLAAQLAATVAFAGVTGMIGYEEADWLVKHISKAMGHPVSLTEMVIKMSEKAGKAVFGEDAGNSKYALSHGLFSFMGLDMSKRLGLQSIAPGSIGEAVFPGSGKLGDAASAAYEAGRYRTEMSAKLLARQISPNLATGVEDRAWFSKDTPQGELAINPKTLRGTAYRNTTDKVYKSLGMTGINESIQRTKDYEVESMSRTYADLRQKPLTQMAHQVFSAKKPDPSTVQDYLKYRGSVETLEGDLKRYAAEQNMSADQLSLLHSATSSSVAAVMKARDFMEMFDDEYKQRRNQKAR